MDNSTPEMSEKLIQYLDGELGGSEKVSLEEQLNTDKSLQHELATLKLAREAVKMYGLRKQVSHIHDQMRDEMQQPTRKIRPTNKILRYSISVAASLVLLIGGYLVYNFFTLSPDKVFASSYQSYSLVTVRDGNTNETSAEKAYGDKNYKEVLRLHDAGEDLTTKGKFLCGAAALELQDYSKANKCFKEVLEANKQTQQPVLNDEAEYYLSLSYVRNKDYDYALELLNKIQGDPNHLYRAKVTGKLIRQVKMLKWR